MRQGYCYTCLAIGGGISVGSLRQSELEHQNSNKYQRSDVKYVLMGAFGHLPMHIEGWHMPLQQSRMVRRSALASWSDVLCFEVGTGEHWRTYVPICNTTCVCMYGGVSKGSKVLQDVEKSKMSKPHPESHPQKPLDFRGRTFLKFLCIPADTKLSRIRKINLKSLFCYTCRISNA